MANKKFSEFELKTTTSDVSHIVGYNGTDNVQITPANFVTTGGTGVFLPLAGGNMTGNTTHNDNVKAIFGAGSDLEIFHSGTDSFIKDVGTGNLKIRATNLNLQSEVGADYVNCVSGGAVELYHNNAKKFETTDTGVLVTGNANFNDDGKAIFGSPGNDLEIYHDGAHSYIQDTSGTGELRVDTNLFRLRSANGGETMIRAFEDGAVILSHNNVDRLTTTSTGVAVTNTGDAIVQVAGDGISNSGGQLKGFNNGFGFTVAPAGGGTYVEAMRLDGAGNLGIGTSNPSVGIQLGNSVSGQTKTAIFNSEGGGEIGLTIKSRTNRAKLLVSDNDSNAYVVAESQKAFFGTSANGDITNIVVDGSGNLGIGTDTPLVKLHLSDPAIVMYLEDSDSTASYNITSISNSGNNLTLDTRNSSGGFVSTDYQIVKNTSGAESHRWFTQGSEKMRLDSSGNLGVGISNPVGKIHAKTSSLNGASEYQGQNFGLIVETDGQSAQFDEGNGIVFTQDYDAGNTTQIRTGAVIGYKAALANSFGGGLKFKVQQFGALPLLTAMTLDMTGNLGVGTSTPSAKIQISGTNANNKIVSYFDGNFVSGFKFSDLNGGIWYDAGADDLYLSAAQANSQMIFEVAGSERMRLDASGNLGINNSNPAFKLQVAGSVALDVMPGNQSEGIVRIGRYDANTTRYNDIKSFVSGTAASNYLKLSVHGGVENATVDVLTLLGSGNATFEGAVTVKSGNKLILNRPNNAVATEISTDSTGAMILNSINDEGFFFNNNGTNAFKLDPINATFAGDVTIAKGTPKLKFDNLAGGGLDPTLTADGSNFTIATSSVTPLSLALDTGNATFAGTIDSGTITSTGIVKASTTFQSTGGSMSFFVPNVGEAMRVEANTGKLGIGVTAPAAKLDILDNTSPLMTRGSAGLAMYNEIASGYSTLALYQLGGNAKIFLNTNGDSFFNGGSVKLATASAGLILTSANGTQYKITVADNGTVTSTAV